MVGDWSQKWSAKVKTNIFPEMPQKGLETVPIASGSPGNRFLYNNNAFLYQYKGPFFPIIYYPYSPVKFPIPSGPFLGCSKAVPGPMGSLFCMAVGLAGEAGVLLLLAERRQILVSLVLRL